MKTGLILWLSVWLAACSSPSEVWQPSHLAQLSDTTIELKSSLWTDMQPKIGKVVDSQNLNGLLTIETAGQLPAELTVRQVVIIQGEENWKMDGEDLELNTQSEVMWEVAFHSDIQLDINKPARVALQLSDNQGKIWLVQDKVAIDKVY